MNISPLFDPVATDYDQWYDSTEGNIIFQEELQCLQHLCSDYRGRWLEVGVGTGRFADALKISCGVDVSVQMVKIAAGRGVKVAIGHAEQLPMRTASLDGVLMVVTDFFLHNLQTAIFECGRVLRDQGRLLIGTLPAEGLWAKSYMQQGAKGHRLYSHCRFSTIDQLAATAAKAGFQLRQACSALLWEPAQPPAGPLKIAPGIATDAGFVGLLFEIGSNE